MYFPFFSTITNSATFDECITMLRTYYFRTKLPIHHIKCEKFRVYCEDDVILKLMLALFDLVKPKRILLLVSYGKRNNWVLKLQHHSKFNIATWSMVRNDDKDSKHRKGDEWSKHIGNSLLILTHGELSKMKPTKRICLLF